MRNDWAPYVAVCCAALALVALVVAVLAFGIDEKSTPMLLTVLGLFGTIVTGLVAAIRSSQALTVTNRLVDTAEDAQKHAQKSAQVGELTASKVAAIQQALLTDEPHLCHDPLCGDGGIDGGKR